MVVEPEFQKLLQTLYKPAQRALHRADIKSFDQLFECSKQKLLDLHGIGHETIKHIEAFTGHKFKD